jgi:hypothetical protein
MRKLSLASTEAERLHAQAALDRRRTAADRNRLGQFATPAELALEMAALGAQHLPARGGISLLDPAVGTGVFFYAARTALGPGRLGHAVGFEIDPEVAAACERLWGSFGLCICAADFCAASPPRAERDKANLVLCNPPYVRHHHLSAEQKARLQRDARDAGFAVSGLAGLYCYFLLLAHRWMAPGAVGVWIVPAEFLDVNYGRALKKYLAGRVALLRLHRFDPEDVQFADALVSSVVVVFRNEPTPLGHTVELTAGSRLSASRMSRTVPLPDLDPSRKWGSLFRVTTETQGNGAATDGTVRVGDLFRVRRGLATGANDYFILERRRAQDLGLPECFLRPILPSPRYIPGTVIEAAADGFPAGLPQLVLLDCDLPRAVIRERYPALDRYLAAGEQRGIAARYLPAHRSPWYRQESRPAPPLLCTYMGRQNGGRAIRFLRNRSAATAPNVYLLLYPRPALLAAQREEPDILDRVFRCLEESVSRLTTGGRVYGGGLSKIEPRELEAIELPAGPGVLGATYAR